MFVRLFTVTLLHCFLTSSGNGSIQGDRTVGYCEKSIDEVCENGGTCVNIGTDDYECVCLNGYSGKNCSWNEDDCVENSCAAGSTCIDGIAKYTCVCPPGRIGLFCHLDDPCMEKPCGSGSECIADTASGEFSCNCRKGTTGQNCATDINECIESDKLCFNGGICVNTFGSWYCDCPPGYNDPYCMTHDNACESSPCLNGASCLDYGNRYECICQDGFKKHCGTNFPAFYGTNCEKTCPPGFEGRSCKHNRITLDNNYQEELFEKQICLLHNCSSKASNYVCDSECNYPACQYDGLDCSARLEPFRHCPLANFCGRVFHDNKCDLVCDRSECLFDGFDCNEKEESCLFEDYCSVRFNDGYCDRECFTEECYFDGDDCLQEIKYDRLEGSLSLVILMKSDEFLKHASVLQFILSQVMQARITIGLDKYNRKRFHSWESDTKELFGTMVHLNVEKTQCRKGDNCKHQISSIEQAADFLGAVSSNQLLWRFGARLHAVEAESSYSATIWKKWIIYTFFGFAMVATLLTLYKNFKRRNVARRLQKKVHVAGTWFPPTLDDYSPLKLLKDNCRSNGNMQCDGSISSNENRQRGHFIEICMIPDAEEEKICERKWTALHNQAMDSFPIRTPVDKLLINIKNNDGKTALMLTALNQEKSEEISCMDVENLFLAGALIDAVDYCGETALIMAIKAGRVEVVKCLLRLGADITIVDIHNRTALHHAASINAADIIRILLETEEVEVDAIDDADCSPLMTVAKLGYRDPEAVALLIDAGADINCTGNHVNGEMYKGRTALHYATIQCNQELARYLVERGANLNIQDHMGQTPLFLAASQGHVEMVHMLVTAGARRYIPDNMGQTPEEVARYKEYREVVQYFTKLRMQNGSVTSAMERSRKKNTKKSQTTAMSPVALETVLKCGTTTITPESSNSSNSSTFLDHSQEFHSVLSHETNTHLLDSTSTIPQHLTLGPDHSTDRSSSRSNNVQNDCQVNDQNIPTSSLSLLGSEHYV